MKSLKLAFLLVLISPTFALGKCDTVPTFANGITESATIVDPNQLSDLSWTWATEDTNNCNWYIKCPRGQYATGYPESPDNPIKCTACIDNNDFYLQQDTTVYDWIGKNIWGGNLMSIWQIMTDGFTPNPITICATCHEKSTAIKVDSDKDQGPTGCQCNQYYHYRHLTDNPDTYNESNSYTLYEPATTSVHSNGCVPNTYTIKFIHNESTDSKPGCLTYPNAEPYTPDKITYNGTDAPSITMPEYTDTKLDQWTGHHFIRWQKCKKNYDISDSSYTEGQSMTITGEDSTRDEISFVAIFAPNKYTIKYDANGANWDKMPSDTTCTYGVECTLGAPKPLTSKDGKNFTGWKVNNEGTPYNGDAKVKNLTDEDGATIILYAQWESCPKGYYCSGGRKYRCPGNSTTDGGALEITDCYLANPTEVYHKGSETNPAEITNIPLKAVKYQGITTKQSL